MKSVTQPQQVQIGRTKHVLIYRIELGQQDYFLSKPVLTVAGLNNQCIGCQSMTQRWHKGELDL